MLIQLIYTLNNMKKGNCVDKFIEKRLNKIDELVKLRENMHNRINIRSEVIDYFNSICYEQDFTDIRKAKEIAQKLVEDYNKFLERISEQYSKLS